MGPPVTRSRAHSAEAWVADTQTSKLSASSGPVEDMPTDHPAPTKMIASLTSALSDMDDASVVHGREAKHLRDATSDAITNVWYDSHYTASQLVQKFNDSNSALLRGLNSTFTAVDNRISSLPTIAVCGPEDGHIPKISQFSGTPYYDFEGWEKDRNKRGARFIKWGGVEDMKYGVSEEEKLLKEKNL
ncbi:hypothetical protein Aduo_010672 [Ancylostoma duodenale]